MRFQAEFVVSCSADIVRQRISGYFLAAGYKEISGDEAVTYQRGYSLGSWISLSPLTWRTVATMRIQAQGESQTAVGVQLDVDTSGQIVTAQELYFWDAERAQIQVAICDGHIDISETELRLREALKVNYRLSAIVVLAVAAVTAGGCLIVGWRYMLPGIAGLVLVSLSVAYAVERIRMSRPSSPSVAPGTGQSGGSVWHN